MTQLVSPNTRIQPATAGVNADGHLTVGGVDAVELAERFGTPLWVLDEETVRLSARAVVAGLQGYPASQVLYAGKAFLCLAMCHLVRQAGLGLDVVSPGELHTAIQAGFPPELIYMHGNNKTRQEVADGLNYGPITIVVDSVSELKMVAVVASQLATTARVLLRVTPGVEPETHHYIKTGQIDSKFGLPLAELDYAARLAVELSPSLQLVGLHAHIGSQSPDLEPYLEIVDILADCFLSIRDALGIELGELDLGGGLGIAYTESDNPPPIYDWSKHIATAVERAFKQRHLALPLLLLEPGRAIVGTAGLTLYRAGHEKQLPGGAVYLALDGGMADNPRPITYQARYSACVASSMSAPAPERPLTLVGKYCESGDIIVKDAYLPASTGDIVALFGTGAYNYSMASNYNRTGRPACVLVSGGQAEVILERESNADLLRNDRLPPRLLQG